jgi:hypothetical protein
MDVVAEKTDPALLERLRASASRKLSKHEIEQQRISFVYSIMGGREGMTRAKVEHLIEQQAGTQ